MLVALMVAAVLSAPPPGFREASTLEPAASYVAGKPATVWCASSNEAWHAALAAAGANPRADGYVLYDGTAIYLKNLSCTTLEEQVSGKNPGVGLVGDALPLLVHEAEHVKGLHDESAADCAMLAKAAQVGILFFHLTRPQLRKIMTYAWGVHRMLGPEYRTLC